ncbi:MAG: putative rane protein [Clostridiales bacterium]|nr:putative rane protein [Clostridiales bacterium]
MLIYAIIFINMALIFYTVAVWGEKLQGNLKWWHLSLFWIGLLFDTLGTISMSRVASEGFKLNFHGISGGLAILLMLFHTLWATQVIIKSNQNIKKKFHKFSLLVWLIWLIPFISGAVLGMMQ